MHDAFTPGDDSTSHHEFLQKFTEVVDNDLLTDLIEMLAKDTLDQYKERVLFNMKPILIILVMKLRLPQL